LKKKTSLQVLGERIRAERKAKSISQENMALEADIDRSYIGGVERGERNPSFKTLCRIARVLDCDVAKFCAGLPLDDDRAFGPK
jgi:transcriptional regulator with XRE-family HTH domain